MIVLHGTSHIARESVSSIPYVIEKENPDIVALELDPNRLQALLSKKRGRYPLLLLLMEKLQRQLAKRTGILPGTEMLVAFKEAQRRSIDVALIDQDISLTVNKILTMPLREKVKLAFYLLTAFLFPFLGGVVKLDLNKVPGSTLIEYMLSEFRKRFPYLYGILVTERNRVMAHNLKYLNANYAKVLAFVGAAHVKGIRVLLV